MEAGDVATLSYICQFVVKALTNECPEIQIIIIGFYGFFSGSFSEFNTPS